MQNTLPFFFVEVWPACFCSTFNQTVALQINNDRSSVFTSAVQYICAPLYNQTQNVISRATGAHLTGVTSKNTFSLKIDQHLYIYLQTVNNDNGIISTATLYTSPKRLDAKYTWQELTNQESDRFHTPPIRSQISHYHSHRGIWLWLWWHGHFEEAFLHNRSLKIIILLALQ